MIFNFQLVNKTHVIINFNNSKKLKEFSKNDSNRIFSVKYLKIIQDLLLFFH